MAASANFVVDASDLLRWAAYVKAVPVVTEGLIADSLNSLGSSIVQSMSEDIAKRTGLTVHQVHGLFRIREASPRRLIWEVDASKAVDDKEIAKRLTGLRRKFIKGKSSPFQEGALVSILTQGDDKVCPICEDLEESGPYTVEDAQKLLPAHPNCRCAILPFAPSRKIPIAETAPEFIGAQTMPEKMTIDQLADRFARAINAAIKVIK